MAFRRPSRGSEPSVMRRDALESRADRGMRAYVTGGRPVTTRAKRDCVRAMASRHIVWASSMARDTRATRRPSRSTHRLGGGDLRVGLRGTVGDACASLQTPRSGGNAQGSEWRDGPRRVDGDAQNSTRTNSRAVPAALRSHLDASIPRRAQDRYVAKTLSRPRPRQRTTLPGLLKVRYSRLA